MPQQELIPFIGMPAVFGIGSSIAYLVGKSIGTRGFKNLPHLPNARVKRNVYVREGMR